MTVERVGEAYTSQTCPSCGGRQKPHGREYICGCGFEGHRDLVGASNIRKKYLGQDEPQGSSLRVAGEGPKRSVMASPTGVRYRPHMRTEPTGSESQRCNPSTVGKTSIEPKGSCGQAGRPVGSGQRSPQENLPALPRRGTLRTAGGEVKKNKKLNVSLRPLASVLKIIRSVPNGCPSTGRPEDASLRG
nr:zinc ribbon domain-containing protein [Salinibacter ruber]